MGAIRPVSRSLLALALAASVVAPAGATTLIRQGLDELVVANRTIVVGEVLDTTSYWNADGTFILTDVRVAVDEALKGSPESAVLTITLMGGSVGDLTALIVAGAELVPGNSYVLFVNEEDLPGAPGVPTVRDHAQGVFDVVQENGGVQAVSQAVRHPLVPDRHGVAEPPGGARGMSLDSMIRSIRELAGGAGNGGR